MDGLVSAGRVGRLFGTNGELMVTLYDAFPRAFDTEEPVFVKIDSLTVPLFFNKFERRGQKGAVVSFEDIDTDDRAQELIGLEFSLREFAEDGGGGEELYMEDLIGWDVELITSSSFAPRQSEQAQLPSACRRFDTGQMGRITDFFDSEFNPLFEIEINGVTELIPASDDFIVEFDEKRRKVIFSLPEGLLGLNE